MDVVYVMAEQVRSGTATNELRYSLRTLVNLPHDRVFIAGWTPDWVRNVTSIPTRQNRTRWINAFNNLRAALPHVSEEFVLMNDDFFIMEPVDRMPVFHRGQLGISSPSTAYQKARASVRHILAGNGIDRPLSYELHVPFVYNREACLETFAYAEEYLIAGFQRSLYGNLNRIGGAYMKDCKVSGSGNVEGLPFLSTNERSFVSRHVGGYIRSRFPEPSPYEG